MIYELLFLLLNLRVGMEMQHRPLDVLESHDEFNPLYLPFAGVFGIGEYRKGRMMGNGTRR